MPIQICVVGQCAYAESWEERWLRVGISTAFVAVGSDKQEAQPQDSSASNPCNDIGAEEC